MLLDSRFIPALFCEVKVGAVSQVQQAEEKAHDAIAKIERTEAFGDTCGQNCATAEHESPTENLHPAWHKKPGGVKGATVKDHPTDRKPQHRQQLTEPILDCGDSKITNDAD